MSNLEVFLVVFICITGIAVVLQTGILLAFYVGAKKSTARLETLAQELQAKATPALELAQSVHGLIQEYRPKIDTVIGNLAETSDSVKRQIAQVDETITEMLERARAQAARADEVLTRTLQRVDETTEVVQHSILTPVRQAGGVLQGVTAGLAAFFRRGRPGLQGEPERDDRFY